MQKILLDICHPKSWPQISYGSRRMQTQAFYSSELQARDPLFLCFQCSPFLSLKKNKYVLTFPGSNIIDHDNIFSAHMHAGSYLQF